MNRSAAFVDYGLALASGVLLVFSFPRVGRPGVAWVALVPLFISLSGWRGASAPLRGKGPLRAFALGLLAGVVCFVGTVYWTGTVVMQFGGLSLPLASFAMLLLALYLGLYTAIAALITSRLIARAGTPGLLAAAAPWVAMEFVRGSYVFGGFPWVPLGSSQVTNIPVAQLASVLGVYGVSALVAIVNALVACALMRDGRRRAAAIGAGVILIGGVAAWGAWRVADGSLTREGAPLTVGLVQPNVPQDEKWAPAQARRILTTQIAMTRDAVRRGAGFVLWPESSTPFIFEEDREGGEAVRALARELDVPILFGSDQIDRGRAPRMYNAAFLLRADGTTAAVYRKIHLVPFGEYVPYTWLFSFATPLVDSLAAFTPGTSVAMLPIGDHFASTSICYEVVFPSLARDAVLQGSELLTTITNDGWYGHSSAPFQHFALASMRAIEEGRYLARSANTGISGIVDPYGRVIEESSIFEQVALVGNVRLLTTRTIYSQVGDVVAYAALALTLAAVVVGIRR